MKNHNCSEILELLSPYIDKELGIDEEKAVAHHIESCSECQKEYTELLELKKLMEEISKEEIQAPEGFAESVMNKIEEEKIQPEVNGKIYSFMDNFFKKPWIPAVIAAMLLVAIYIPDQLGPLMYKGEEAKEDSMNNEVMLTFTAEDAKAKEGLARTSGMMNSAATPAPQVAPDFAPSPGSGEFADNVVPEERKIIRNGYVSADITDYDKTEKDITAKTQELGGYIAGSNSYYYGENQDLQAGSMEIRIPEHRFDEMMSFLESAGKINSKNTSTNDVTEQFFDINTRVNNLRIKEERLLEILSKQGELKDLLAVEQELADTRSEIESLEGRLNFLSGQVAYSTINIELREVKNLDDSIAKDSVSGIGSKIKESVIKSINKILDLGVKGIILISSALPFLLILGVVYFVFRVIWNKKKRDL